MSTLYLLQIHFVGFNLNSHTGVISEVGILCMYKGSRQDVFSRGLLTISSLLVRIVNLTININSRGDFPFSEEPLYWLRSRSVLCVVYWHFGWQCVVIVVYLIRISFLSARLLSCHDIPVSEYEKREDITPYKPDPCHLHIILYTVLSPKTYWKNRNIPSTLFHLW